nr:uncharacterized mitochondrial protein AtMg00810-like [Tanacetum cinerariifolium]
MALGKDISNPLMDDNLLKIVWYSTHHITLMKSWLVQKQTALGKDSSNSLTVDSLLKTIWFSIHHLLTNEVLAIPGQMATGKEISNPFMTGVNTPRSDEDRLEILELTVFVLQKFWNTVTVKQSADVTRSMIGSLMYLTSSRSDIMFTVCACARFQVTPKASHLHAVKRIVRYMKGKPHLGLWYPKDSPFDLVAYLDSNYAGASLDKKSTTEGCQFLGCRLVSWQCKKQTVVATSSTEAEYVVAARVNTLKSDEDRLEILELTVFVLQKSLSAKRTSWNEFSFAMAYVVICLSTGRKFNFSKHIFDSMVKNVNSSSKFYMYPRFIQLIIQNQLGDLSTHTIKYISLALTQKVFANMRRVRKGFSGVETPLFEGMLVAEEIKSHTDAEEQIQGNDNDAQGADADVLGDDVQDHFISSPASPTPPPSPPAIPSTSHVQSPPPQPQSPAQPHGADFPMSLLQEALDAYAALTRRIKHLEHDKVALNLEITKLKTRAKKLERANKVKTLKLRRLRKVGTSQIIESSDYTIMEDVINLGRKIDELDRDEGVALMGEKEEEKKANEVKDIAGDEQVKGRQAEIYQIDMDHAVKVLSMQEKEPEVQEVVEVVTTAKLITEVVTAASTPVSAASTIIPAAEPKVSIAAPVKVAAAFTR